MIDILDPREDLDNAEKSMNELESLVNTYGGLVVVKKTQKKQQPNYATYVGSGKLDEIHADLISHKSKLLIVNNILKPRQLFNISQKLEKDGIEVWDRVDLILKIFEKHASSAESKLQIELAAIRHMGPRIYGMGLELSSQGAGIGTRGLGETNTEIMKRHLAAKEQKILKKIEKVKQMRRSQRMRRSRQNLKTVAIVGYTNAGKSQLLSALTQKRVKVKNELFATLDTRIAQLYLPISNNICLLSDTIGFIQKLPPSLIDAFLSTLEETVHADLLLHVVDGSDPEYELKINVVNQVLDDLDIHTDQILILNKSDLKAEASSAFISKTFKKKAIKISALKKTGIKELLNEIDAKLF